MLLPFQLPNYLPGFNTVVVSYKLMLTIIESINENEDIRISQHKKGE